MRKPTDKDFETGINSIAALGAFGVFVYSIFKHPRGWGSAVLWTGTVVLLCAAAFGVAAVLGVVVNDWKATRPERKKRRHVARQDWLHSGPDRGKRF